jgi:hypothetical protein
VAVATWTDTQVEHLRAAGLTAAASRIIGHVIQFSSSDGDNVVLTATVTGLVVTDTYGVQLTLSVPEFLGQPIKGLAFRGGSWKLELAVDGVYLNHSTMDGQVQFW